MDKGQKQVFVQKKKKPKYEKQKEIPIKYMKKCSVYTFIFKLKQQLDFSPIKCID